MTADPRPLLLAYLDADDETARAAMTLLAKGHTPCWTSTTCVLTREHDPECLTDTDVRLNAALRDILARVDDKGFGLYVTRRLATALTPGWQAATAAGAE